ncbi:Golgi apyrase [Bachmanniomyces sp. S44760]|nr:Golgi apyrase [Bachmanniomyces sp. S44760]
MDEENQTGYEIILKIVHEDTDLTDSTLVVGISTFGGHPEDVGDDHLKPLFDHALEIVKDQAEETPIFLLATAGVRLLPDHERKILLTQICSYARSHTKFLLPDCDIHVQVIPGETEGLYGWIAANYLLGGFDAPEEHDHGKGHHTYGFLDMGGASAQIAFAPNATEADRHANDLKLLRLRTVDGDAAEYRVFVTTWLGFGVHEARNRYVKALLEGTGGADSKALPDPCLPKGLTLTTDGKPWVRNPDAVQSSDPYLLGTGLFDECLRETYPLLDKEAPCEDEPCLLHGVHVPAIDFDVNHFVGVSEYWHTTHEIFEMGHKDQAYDFNTYQEQVQQFCTQDWTAIQNGIKSGTWGKKVDAKAAEEVCFKASWLITVLHNGIGIPRIGLENTKSTHNSTKELLQSAKNKGFTDPFQAIDKIGGTEVSWTLGKMVLYAASQIPPLESKLNSLPVGFGSNVPNIPADFQYPGSSKVTPSWNATHPDPFHAERPAAASGDEDIEDSSWKSSNLFSSHTPRRIPGLLLFVLILCIAAFLLCGRDRRSKIFRKLCPSRANLKRRPNSPGTLTGTGLLGSKVPFFGSLTSSQGAYERVLEDGGPLDPADFELGELDESDDSSSSSYTQGKASGWAALGGSTSSEQVHHHGAGDAPYRDNIVNQSQGLGLGPVISSTAMDRSGLFGRTESRERLTGLNGNDHGHPGGRKSRKGSPIRGKSPLMAALSEDM